MDRWATFDCYGTLVDWDGGIRSTLERLFPGERGPALLERYHELEPVVEAEAPTLGYRAVLARTLRRTADAAGLELAVEDEDALGASLPGWDVFPEVPPALAELRRRGWRLGVLSNTDPDLIAASLAAIGVPFDEVVTAADAGSYKPAHGHWHVFFERTGASPSEHVHVAASLFHDIGPANELGLASVWINRLGEPAGPSPTRELRNLDRLPETLADLRP